MSSGSKSDGRPAEKVLRKARIVKSFRFVLSNLRSSGRALVPGWVAAWGAAASTPGRMPR